MVAPVPSQISSAPRNVRSPSTLNSFRILPVATGVGTLSPLVFQASSLPYPASSTNPRRLILLQTLCRRQNTQLLWNQANPNSFAKTPEVGVPRFPFQPPTAHYPPLTTHSLLSTFRMNTCKSVSKQSTLTTFRMNTYAKRGGGGLPCGSQKEARSRLRVRLTLGQPSAWLRAELPLRLSFRDGKRPPAPQSP